MRLTFFSACRFFALSLLSFCIREGRFFLRIFGGTIATSSNEKKRFITSSLFLCWLRPCWEASRSTPSFVRRWDNFSLRRLISSSEKAVVFSNDQYSSTRELVLFTCCPPAPLLRVALKLSSVMSCSLSKGVFVSAAALAAVGYFLPVFLPFFTPREGSLAYRTYFSGEMLLFHKSGLSMRIAVSDF